MRKSNSASGRVGMKMAPSGHQLPSALQSPLLRPHRKMDPQKSERIRRGLQETFAFYAR